MNYFFGIKSKHIDCEIRIPIFKNNGERIRSPILISCEIKNDMWFLKKLNINLKNDFFVLNNDQIDNEKVFFVDDGNFFKADNIEKGVFLNEIQNFNCLTDTEPQFRCNLKIYNNTGFSSYQSEYPFKMIERSGNILSPIYPLLNENSNQNLIFLKNIYFKPIYEKFDVYLVDIKKMIIIGKYQAVTNKTNEIVIDNKLIKEDYYIFSQKFIGIPIYVSIYNNAISMEHTHPPHHYILSQDKYKIVSKLKKKINEIVN